jgi:hypothetical protein
MTRTVLVTGTRAPATLDLARRLWRQGIRVIGADSIRFPIGSFSRAFAAHYRVPPPRQEREGFLGAIEAIARREQVDLIWPTCEEVLHLATGKASLEAVAPVFCPDLEVLDRLHHKLHFAELVRDLATEVASPESRPASAAPLSEGPWVWKPFYSRFASRTRFTPPEGDLAGWMAQRRVEGREVSSWALCVGGEMRVLTQYHCPARSGRGAGCAFEPHWSTSVEVFTRAVAGVLGYTGSLAFDFIESEAEGRSYVLECNPRMTSGIHLLPPDIDLAGVLDGGAVTVSERQRPTQLLLPTLISSPGLAGTSPDVLTDDDDPRPAWVQGLALAEIAWRSAARRVSLLEATTVDIEYDGC